MGQAVYRVGKRMYCLQQAEPPQDQENPCRKGRVFPWCTVEAVEGLEHTSYYHQALDLKEGW